MTVVDGIKVSLYTLFNEKVD